MHNSTVIADVDCGGLDIINGYISYSTGTTYNSVATYSCDTGYELQGGQTRTCQNNGTWSGDMPSCQSKAMATWLAT